MLIHFILESGLRIRVACEKDPMLILKSRTFPKTHIRIYDARSFRIGSRDLKRQLALSFGLVLLYCGKKRMIARTLISHDVRGSNSEK